MTAEEEIRALAKRFFDAIEVGDVAGAVACYADDVRVWHNTDEIEQTRDESAVVIASLATALAGRRYADRRVETFPGGFVQQHMLEALRHDGRTVRLPAVIVGRVRDGRIVRIDEYFDSARVAMLRAPAI